MDTKKRNTIIWTCVVLAIIGIVGFYFYQQRTETTTDNKDPKSAYEDLLEMDYEVVELEELDNSIVLKLKGAFRESDIVTYQNKLINMVKKRNIDVYYFENSATEYTFDGAMTPDLIAYTNTNFNDFVMYVNTYQELPNIEKAQILNQYNQGDIYTDEGKVLTVELEMDVDPEDLTSIVANAKSFIDLFKVANPEKTIDTMKLRIISGENAAYIYNTAEPNYLLLQEIKTFSKK